VTAPRVGDQVDPWVAGPIPWEGLEAGLGEDPEAVPEAEPASARPEVRRATEHTGGASTAVAARRTCLAQGGGHPGAEPWTRRAEGSVAAGRWVRECIGWKEVRRREERCMARQFAAQDRAWGTGWRRAAEGEGRTG
jgi:hypothetical protein